MNTDLLRGMMRGPERGLEARFEWVINGSNDVIVYALDDQGRRLNFAAASSPMEIIRAMVERTDFRLVRLPCPDDIIEGAQTWDEIVEALNDAQGELWATTDNIVLALLRLGYPLPMRWSDDKGGRWDINQETWVMFPSGQFKPLTQEASHA